MPEAPELAPVPVLGGMEETVEVRAGAMPEILMKASEAGQVEESIVWKEKLTAPVEEGDVVGRIIYSVGGKEAARVDLTAAGSVEAVTFSSAFRYLLGGFLRL